MQVTKPKKVYWYRTIMNGYEPDNRICINAELTEDGEKYEAYGMCGSLTFRDGSSIVYITRIEDGKFEWRNDDREGVADSFDEAWEMMPRMVTSPDHWEEGQIYDSVANAQSE